MSKTGFAAAITVAFIFLALFAYRIVAGTAGLLEYGYVAIFLISAGWTRLQIVRRKKANRHG